MAISNKTKNTASSSATYILVVALVGAIVLICLALISRALISDILLNNKLLGKQSTAASQLQSNLTSAPQLVSSYDDLGNLQATINDALPSDPDVKNLIASLENMAGQAGVSLTSVAAGEAAGGSAVSGPTTTGTGVQSLPITISITSSYNGLQQFLANIENSARPITVQTIQVTGSGSTLTDTITGNTFYQSPVTVSINQEVIK